MLQIQVAALTLARIRRWQPISLVITDTISLTIDWRDADSDMPEEQQEVLTQRLFQELRTLDEVEEVRRVADPAVPKGGMGAQWLWSVLTADSFTSNNPLLDDCRLQDVCSFQGCD